MSLCDVASFVTAYFRFKKSFPAKRKRDFTANLAISQNDCWRFGFLAIYFGRNRLTLKHNVGFQHKKTHKGRNKRIFNCHF